MLQIFNLIGIGRGIVSAVIGNVAVVLPYVVFVVVARLRGLDENLIEAGRSLGATQLKSFCRITVPLAMPSILGSALLAFVVCFNNFTIQYFLLPLGVRTLPLEIYSQVRTGYSPAINALATVVLLGTVLISLLLERLGAGSKRFRD
jgi:spermidine/putrescine transport system permease protein